MARKWYYSQNKQMAGPISSSELKDLIRANKLLSTDLVQEEGTNRWHKVSVLKEKAIEPTAKSTESAIDRGVQDPPKPVAATSDTLSLGKTYFRALNGHPGIKKWLLVFICFSSLLLAAWLVQWIINLNKDPNAEYETRITGGRFNPRVEKVLTQLGKQKANERDQAAKDEKLRKLHEQMVQSGKVTDYRKPELSQQAYEDKNGIYSLYLIPGEWVRAETSKNEGPEIDFTLQGKDCHSSIISEQVTMPIQSVTMQVITRYKETDPDARIKQDIRRVNGTIVYCLIVNAKSNGIPLVMYGYYASGKKGVVQAVTWTRENLLEEHRPKMEEFLNGIVFTKE
ncbi:MAG TPA: DUF4339 domain-containing protein [Gemmatales bacterium]|nr:DUF4339 domain-containing protein [Gemmatales bacterium]